MPAVALLNCLKQSLYNYSDVAAHFLADIHASKISFEVKDLEYKFSNGNIGLRNINFCENHGRLVGIMGASGAGKTTLLNVLCGIEKPSSGEVLINGVNLHTQKKEIERGYWSLYLRMTF